MKTITLSILAVTALAGAAVVAVGPGAIAHEAGWGGNGGGMMGMMGGGGMMGGHGMMGGGMGGGPREMFEQLDTDNDDRLTQAEIDAAIDAKFAEANADGQGGVTLEEFEPWFWAQHRERMVRAFQFLDRDGDGTITREEVGTFTGGMVERMDRNDDGVLTLEDRGRRGEGRRGWGMRDDDGERWGRGMRGDDDGWGPRGWWGDDDDDRPRRRMMDPDGQMMGPGEGMGPPPGMGPGNGPGPQQNQ